MPHRSGESFLWGVATSGYQAEGGFNGPGEPLNNWVWAENSGQVAATGRTSDFWNLSHEDFARCQGLGLSAFRMSLEWARIQPTREMNDPAGLPEGTEPPPFDERALYSYAQRIADCRAQGLEPIITLHHFVQPAWLGLDAWQNPRTIEHFITFVEHTVSYLLRVLPHDFGCEPPRWFITINEPNLFAFNHYLYRIFPSGKIGLNATTQCLAHVLEAHIRAYRTIHAIYEKSTQRPMVSFNNYASDLYWCDTGLLDLLFAAHRNVPRENVTADLWKRAKNFEKNFSRAHLFPIRGPRYFVGQILKKIHHGMAQSGFRDSCWQRLIDVLYESSQLPLDYIAFDYYDPFIAHALRWPDWHDFESRKRSFRDWVLESVASKWWDWRLLPEGLAFFTSHFAQFGLPLMIAENGMALRQLSNNRLFRRRDKLSRSQYLREHVRVVSRLVEQGFPLVGYLHWSLFDNYEWGSFAPRFGLYSIDYTVYPNRHAVDPSGDNPSATYAQEIAEANERFERAARRKEKELGATSATTGQEMNSPLNVLSDNMSKKL